MAETMTYRQLQQAVTELGRTIVRSAEAIRQHAQAIDDEAKDTTRVADMIGAMRVDTATTAETRELARIMAGLSEATLAYATAGDTTARAARAAHAQARDSHGGIHEAVIRAAINVRDTDRDWFRQE